MKTEHIQKQLDFFVRDKSHHAYRKPAEDPHALAAQFAAQGLDDMQRSVGRLRYVLAQETPVVFPDERITLLRTVRTIPEIHTEEEDRKLHETHAFHENGRVFNMCPDYGMLMADGFTKKAEKIRAQLEAAQTPEQKEFLQAMLDVLDLVTAFAARYREEAVRVGNQTVADMLAWIPANAPRTLLEALQFLRLLHYAMWCNGNYHNTLGRIDQFLYPYYRHDVDAGPHQRRHRRLPRRDGGGIRRYPQPHRRGALRRAVHLHLLPARRDSGRENGRSDTERGEEPPL